MIARDDGVLLVVGPTGDLLRFFLPEEGRATAATYRLAEPILARLLGAAAVRTVGGEFVVRRYRTQVGGMGAGFALALGGLLRAPFGRDAVAELVLGELATAGVRALPEYLSDCASDTSLVIISPRGDKLCVGVRQAMIRWRTTPRDRALVHSAASLIFCGAPQAMLAEVFAWRPDVPVMCAPAMRNVSDVDCPLAEFAAHIHYLALNALEWEHLPGKERLREEIPVISITDGPHGSRILLRGGAEYAIPATPRPGPLNTNRAGETYASTFFKVLLHDAPTFFRTRRLAGDIAVRAGQIASRQAARQLDITGFAFPPDDWMR
jgi:sugar/nucleoside kinase (ribokinase family)